LLAATASWKQHMRRNNEHSVNKMVLICESTQTKQVPYMIL
jgi:hypothetical protein